MTSEQIRKYYEKRLTELPSRVSGSGEVSVRCPFHADSNPSMNVNLGTGCWYCHAEKIGGNLFQFEQRLSGCDYVTALRNVSAIIGCDLLPPSNGWGVEDVYPYSDEDGKTLYEVVRWRDQEGNKQIRQRKPRPDGRYANRLDEGGELRRVLYDLPNVIRASDVIVTEGEKDANLVRNLEWGAVPSFAKAALAVTTNPGGAGKWIDAYSPFLTGKRVVIFRDNDDPGIKHAEHVALSIYPFTKRIKIITVPTHDVGDLINEGATASDLLKLINETPWWTPPEAQADGLRVVDALALVKMVVAPREMVLEPIIPIQGLAMLHSKRGVGKTYLAIGIAHAVASGGQFLNWKAPSAQGVLYVDGELPLATLKERVATVCGLYVSDNLKFITPDMQSSAMPDLSTAEGQSAVERHLDGVKLLILDNLSCLLRSGKENEGESWLPTQEFILRLRRKGISVLLIHHAGKSGLQRGTSRREDLLDSVILLQHPGDYSPRDGLRCEVHYEKARGFFGDDAREFEVRMQVQEGIAIWTTSDIQDSAAQAAAGLFKSGLSVRDVAEELGISKSTAGRLRQRVLNGDNQSVPLALPQGLGQRDSISASTDSQPSSETVGEQGKGNTDCKKFGPAGRLIPFLGQEVDSPDGLVILHQVLPPNARVSSPNAPGKMKTFRMDEIRPAALRK